MRYLDEYKYAFDSANELGGIVGELAVIDTSFLYETAPMYVTEQPSFINCACLVISVSYKSKCVLLKLAL